ncbi:MAG TPA: S8 family serine peptidase [Bacillus sp. (in: firmicutes)]|nr:S8 family serine peptidase [Bacillus sp. (in: firmicutes)]
MSKALILLLFLYFLGMGTEAAAYTLPNRPPVDFYLKHEVATKIFLAKEQITDEKIKYLETKYPGLDVRTVYREVFNGFSAKGTHELLERVQREEWVEDSHPLSYYRVSADESIPFIGGENVRGKLDSEGFRLTGRGVKIGIIDTGIDYNHPDLHGNYQGGFDTIEMDEDPMETLPKEGHPTSHGTHVAGVIAGNGKMKGVAPEAELYIYRALGAGGFGTSEQVLLAIEKAVEDQVDILNLSLGNDVNGPDWPTSLALDKAVEKGIVAVTSSGNSGPALWSVGSPGTSSKAISVGASTPPSAVPYLKIGSLRGEYEIKPFIGTKEWKLKRDYEVVDRGVGEKKELKDVRGKVVLVHRGGLSFMEKVQNVEKAGAAGLIIVNNAPGSFTGLLQQDADIPVASMSKETGEKVKGEIKKGRTFLSFSYKEKKDILAPFSSRGPVTETWEIKPDILAPGMNITSTTPNGYEEMHGTSMAAPHVAGACALILQAHPDWSPEQVKAALMNNSKVLREEGGDVYPPYEQGSGRVQIVEAINARTLIYPSSLSFGVYEKKKLVEGKELSITIENVSNKSQSYHFEAPRTKGEWGLPLSFTLDPNEKRKIDIRLTIEGEEVENGIHDGFLNVEASGKRISLPYIFIVGEPNYPRMMGFRFGRGEEKGEYWYQIFLPGGADEMGVALYDPVTLRFIEYFDVKKNVRRGLMKQVVKTRMEPGVYKALVFVKKGQKEDILETTVNLE